jgi:3'-5' exoribonuclease
MHCLGLIHALTAAKGAPAHLGLREPRSLEATILSMADRLSGEGELFERMAPTEGGFGQFHKHMKGRPFVVAREESDECLSR